MQSACKVPDGAKKHCTTMSGPGLHVLLIGDTSRAEFCDAGAALEEVARVTCFAEVAAAIAAISSSHDMIPHAVVLAQARPGQFTDSAIDRLRGLAPLARWIAILGSWCEGESRSGHPLPGMTRSCLASVGRCDPPRVRPLVRVSRFRVATTAYRDGGGSPAEFLRRTPSARQRVDCGLDAAAGNGGPLFRRLPCGRLCYGLVASASSGAAARRSGSDL